MKLILIFAIFLFTTMGSEAMAQPGLFKVVDTVSGRGGRAIQEALPEIIRRKLNISAYRVVVMESDVSFLVLLEDPDAPNGQQGSTSSKPGFEVELSKPRLQVIRANFVR